MLQDLMAEKLFKKVLKCCKFWNLNFDLKAKDRPEITLLELFFPSSYDGLRIQQIKY